MFEFDLYVSDTIGDSGNCVYRHKKHIIDRDTFAEAVKYDNVCTRFRNNYRNGENFESANVVPMDCDNEHSDLPEEWVHPKDVAEAFTDCPFYVSYSRSNMKPKNGKSARPRFHVYFPIPEMHDGDAYANLKKRIQHYFPYFDKNALDKARFLYGTDCPKTDVFDGNNNIAEFISQADFAEYEILSESISEGSRNSTMSHYAGKLIKRYGNTVDAYSIYMQIADKCYPPLDDKELKQIWNSAAKFGTKVAAQAGYIPPEKYNADVTDMLQLPEPITLSSVLSPPQKPPELIHGILRKGHKMLIAGPSKAGKSFLLMELAIAIAEGRQWLGFHCERGKVLYVNLEIDPASCINRFLLIYNRIGIENRHTNNIIIWNLRGHALPLNILTPLMIEKMKNETISAVIIDPIYKVITGDENNASEMGAFCNQFDKICTAMGASAIYCHHHSKGHQGGKKAMDRASGSGVFARDPDAQLDIIELKKSAADDDDDSFENMNGTRTAWRMEACLREFPPIKNVNFYFDHPIHTLDTDGLLAMCHPAGSAEANLGASSKRTTPEQRKRRLDKAFESAPRDEPITVKALAELAEVSADTLRRYLKEFGEDYMVKNGVVIERPPLSEI